MEKSKHTPGLWRVGVNQNDGVHVVCDERLICETPGGGYCGLELNDSGKAQSLANAKLIAAAPDTKDAADQLHASMLALEKFLRDEDIALPVDLLDQCETACAKWQVASAKAGL